MALLGLGFKDSILAAARSLVKGFRRMFHVKLDCLEFRSLKTRSRSPLWVRTNMFTRSSAISRSRSGRYNGANEQRPGRLFPTMTAYIRATGLAAANYALPLWSGRDPASNPRI
jgi:hypothetical protein